MNLNGERQYNKREIKEIISLSDCILSGVAAKTLLYIEFFPVERRLMVLAEISRLWRLVRSENISDWTDEIWFLDRFNTIRLPSPLKDFLERQESQSACKEFADKSISTSLVRGWNSREERTESLLFSSLSWLS